jgi:hypothetical protein
MTETMTTRDRTPFEQIVFSAVNGWMTEFVTQLLEAADDVLAGATTEADLEALSDADDYIGRRSLLSMARGEFYNCEDEDGPDDSPCPVGIYPEDLAESGLTMEQLTVARPLAEVAEAVRKVWGRP